MKAHYPVSWKDYLKEAAHIALMAPVAFGASVVLAVAIFVQQKKD